MLDQKLLYKKVRKKVTDLWSLANSEEHHDHTIGRYYPSDAGKCMRKTYFKYVLNTNSDMRIVAKGRIIMSQIVENMYLEILQSIGYETKKRVEKRHGDFVIAGEVDAMSDDEVIDVKTVTPTSINNIPFSKDIAQLNTYLWLTDLQYGWLLYVKSDNPAIYKIYPVHYSPKMMSITLSRISQLHQYLVNNIIPPKTEDQSVCRNCMFRKLCERIG